MPNTMHVRLKPYDKRRGHILRIYTIYGVRFMEKRGWYEVPTSLAKKLKELPQRTGDENSPRAFDVKTAEEAKTVDVEAKQKVERREAKDANPVRVRETRMPEEDTEVMATTDLSTSDLPDGDDAPPAKASSGGKKRKPSSRSSK